MLTAQDAVGQNSATANAADHTHHHHEAAEEIERPRVFLDKSPRVVQYQLQRLDNRRLLLVERQTNDPIYKPVYAAILTRDGIARLDREEALAGLVILNRSDPAVELLQAMESLDDRKPGEERTGRQLAAMLLDLPPESLNRIQPQLQTATTAANSLLRAVGLAGLLVTGHAADVWQHGNTTEPASIDRLTAVSLIPRPVARAPHRTQVVELLHQTTQSSAVRKLALSTLAAIPAEQADTFALAAEYVSDPELSEAAVAAMLSVPNELRDSASSQRVAVALVKQAETTDPADRTTEPFIDAMQLADQLLARFPVEEARQLRTRLREVAVRVVTIHTVEEEMRYDVPWFAVQAGRPVQVILRNEDLMPHNLVITRNGALKEVADAGAVLGPNPGFQQKQYVPESDLVLYATDMVPSGKHETLTFTAPDEPGEYPYVCTFPRHWMRMYGVMVVVADLDEWLQNPVPPKDPIGSNRSFVQAWTVSDFTNGSDLNASLEEQLRGRLPAVGERLFKEATCAQCHRIRGTGGNVGPELTDVFKRWKGDTGGILREILDPSHRIDPRYAVHAILTSKGDVLTGIIQADNKDSIALMVNPEAASATIVPKSDIDEMVQSDKSMMPKALLDRFTREEVLEIVGFLRSLSDD
ncbi:MAG: c-type cytochrome [Planctomycetaceae bacterium]|nr:c-type cytochrome [Planctomycetaceae bacterium]